MEKASSIGVKIKPISRSHQLIDDYTTEAKSKNLIWATTECDITVIRDIMRAYTKKTGEKISFTAFLIAVIAHVAEQHKFPINTLRKGRKKFYIFDDVDVMTNIERVVDGVKKPTNYTVRKAQNKTLKEIHDEIRTAQHQKSAGLSSSGKKTAKLLKILIKMPRFIRRMVIHKIFTDPMLKKQLLGTIGVTSVGMFGIGMGKMIHITPHTLSMGVGGIEKMTYVLDDKVVIREFLGITLAMDHAIIDGGPATRFLHDLRYTIEYRCIDQDWCFKSLGFTDEELQEFAKNVGHRR
ncbi:MAG: 2-oxo acid dehydrogenase subunit E2 [Candidatus Lokiarchaeota archaeon]|nr:2-oxo acid dehydrogenase subunit E2 [Candidatus Harpocratesius repetitus]